MVELQLLNKGFKAAGMYAGLRADLALVTCDVEAVAAGVFTTIIVAPAPVVCCKKVLETSKTARAVLINVGQANAAPVCRLPRYVRLCWISCEVSLLFQLLKVNPEEMLLIESTGVIGQEDKKGKSFSKHFRH